jgi:hypothetical protein
MTWPLSTKETLGVAAVGLALAAASNAATTRVPAAQHNKAMLASGVLLYTLGVAIGAKRPAGGW